MHLKFTSRNKKILFGFFIITLIYSSYYSIYPARPGVNFAMGFESTPGWQNWYDQGQYYIMSQSIADGSFDSSKFVYGIGYPLTGVPFSLNSDSDSFFSVHRFFIPNLLMFFSVVYMTYSLLYQLTKNNILALCCVASMLFLTLYLSWFIEPWNIHVVDVGILGIFYLLFRANKESSKTSVLIAGLLAGWIFSSRYIDLFWVLPMFVPFLIFNPKKIIYLIPGVLIVLLILSLHVIYFDDAFELPYALSVAADFDNSVLQGMPFKAIDWDLQIISKRIYCILFEPMYCEPPKTGIEFVDTHWHNTLFDKTPILASTSGFLILSPFGFALILKKSHNYQRWILIALLIGFVSAMISYNASAYFAAGWTRFFRYEMAWIPLSCIFSFYGFNYLYDRFLSREKPIF